MSNQESSENGKRKKPKPFESVDIDPERELKTSWFFGMSHAYRLIFGITFIIVGVISFVLKKYILGVGLIILAILNFLLGKLLSSKSENTEDDKYVDKLMKKYKID
jgi:hypothetical protein